MYQKPQLLIDIENFIQGFEMVFDADWPHSKAFISEMDDDKTLLTTPTTGKWSCHEHLIKNYIAVKKEIARLYMLEAEKQQRTSDKLETDFLKNKL